MIGYSESADEWEANEELHRSVMFNHAVIMTPEEAAEFPWNLDPIELAELKEEGEGEVVTVYGCPATWWCILKTVGQPRGNYRVTVLNGWVYCETYEEAVKCCKDNYQM